MRRNFWYLIVTLVVVVGTFVATLLGGQPTGARPGPAGRHLGRARAGGRGQERGVARQGRRHHPEPGRRARCRRARDQPAGIERDHRPPGRARPRQGAPPRRQDRGAALPAGPRGSCPPRALEQHDHDDEAGRPRPRRPRPGRRRRARLDHHDHGPRRRSRRRRRPRTRPARTGDPARPQDRRQRREPPSATSSVRPRSPGRASSGAKAAVPRAAARAGSSTSRSRTTARRVQPARPGVVPKRRPAERGRDRARRRRAVRARVPDQHRSKVATVQISGDFSEGEAKDLATVLQYGALPVQLKELTTQSVSPSLGTDQLEAGIAAGVIGLALVALYMLALLPAARARRDPRAHPRGDGGLHADLVPRLRRSV